jgi:integrating conjugative element protein (TIGR03765 family)
MRALPLCFLLFCIGEVIHAEPQVIFDSGDTIPAEPYKAILNDVQVPDFGKSWIFAHAPLIEKSPYDLSTWLPLHTDKLTPAVVDTRIPANFNLSQPLCVIGSDPLSLEWIAAAKDFLIERQAVCWIVEAASLEDYSNVHRLMEGVVLLPADGDDIADFLHIEHYPVIITERYISQ